MEEIDKAPQNKLPSQEIDYFKIAKILISRWYWIAGSVLVCTIAANIYLWYYVTMLVIFKILRSRNILKEI